MTPGSGEALARLTRERDARKARDEAYRSCGMVRVKGAMGGTFWE